MKYEILYDGAFPVIRAFLEKGETIKAESDAMVSMSATMDIKGSAEGGIFKGLGRMLAGEKFFFQIITAKRGSGQVILAPATNGSIIPLRLDGSTKYTVQKDGFLAGTEGITVDTQMQNLAKGLFSGAGFFVLKTGGNGTVFINSYGAIHTLELQPGEEMIIDNYHLVAWPENMNYKIEKASSGWISSVTSGEGLVCRFTGPGKVMIQTRNPSAFGSWVATYIPSQK